MERFGRYPAMEGSQSDPQVGWNSPVPETGLEVSMWQLGLGSRESYPERPGEPNCVYYMRTGSCGYGDRCRYNHPRDRSMAAGAVRQGGGEYPEREGQPVCQFFLKTGTCKFGAYCKFHHPKYGGGSMSPVALNYYGYPLRPGEKECSYYVKTGQCKFGVTCKFHHPQPAGASMPAPAPAPAFYPTVQSPSVPSQSYGGAAASWQVARPTLVSGSYVQGAFGPVLLPPGMVPISGWSPYPAPLSPVASPGTQPTVRAAPLYGVTQLSPSATEFAGPYRPLPSPAAPSNSSVKEHMFPERPGQPECPYYMRTGDCKFGTTCRYHHPPEWITPKTNCVLSAMGLPLRPGKELL
ncbi:zinc finger protein [Macleaya cordata]|uniref:Zinc finger protein n=1 Tax=Macleaya cordata TaxID=56857 RepID=A0A200QX02_MACCD|nr:zinc finger protein [Macleaya cordata]